MYSYWPWPTMSTVSWRYRRRGDIAAQRNVTPARDTRRPARGNRGGSALPGAANARLRQRVLLDFGPGRRAALPPVRRVRGPRAPTGAVLRAVRRSARAHRGERPGHRLQLHREPPGVGRHHRSVRDRAGGHRRAARRAPHLQSRRLRARRRAHRHADRGRLRRPRSDLPPTLSPRDTRSGSVSAFERQSVISGIGQSAIGRRLNRTGVDLTIEAAQAAVADAGLTFADIDGLATYPGGGGVG